MSKEEYAEFRDMFLAALIQVRNIQMAILDDISGWVEEAADDPYHALNERGHWITGNEYEAFEDIISTLEKLVGRAHERAV